VWLWILKQKPICQASGQKGVWRPGPIQIALASVAYWTQGLVVGCGVRVAPESFRSVELLSNRAPPELHKPDNFITFVPSPIYGLHRCEIPAHEEIYGVFDQKLPLSHIARTIRKSGIDQRKRAYGRWLKVALDDLNEANLHAPQAIVSELLLQ
jgi:hypothetical protein